MVSGLVNFSMDLMGFFSEISVKRTKPFANIHVTGGSNMALKWWIKLFFFFETGGSNFLVEKSRYLQG